MATAQDSLAILFAPQLGLIERVTGLRARMTF